MLVKPRSRLLAFLFVVAPFLLAVMGFAAACGSSDSPDCDCNPSTEDIPYCENCAF